MSSFYKYLILGAGPGGLQMAYYLRNRSDYLILERDREAGSFFRRFPVHRRLISINKKHNFFAEDEFNWRHDWNSLLSDDDGLRFGEHSEDLYPRADVLHHYLKDFAEKAQLNIAYGVTVTRIVRADHGGFRVETSSGTNYDCRILLCGLGAAGIRMPRDIPGIELTTPYPEQSLDRETYRNKRVGILGQGNSAFETAEALSGVAAFVHVLTHGPIRFAWETHFVGDLRAVNNNIFDMYQLKSLHAVLSPRIKEIRRTDRGTLETSHEYDYPRGNPPGTLQLTREYDHIIAATGWNWVHQDLFDADVDPATKRDGQYPLLNHRWESANVPGLYFIGAAMQANDRQSASGFIHGFRYNIRTLYHLLMESEEGIPYPTREFSPLDWEAVLEWMYARFSLSAALFQLYGTLCDVLVFSEDLHEATLFEELPLALVRERDLGDRHALVFTLEFGFHRFGESSLSFMGPSDPTDTHCAAFLHPVIRHWRQGEESEFHFGDSLLGRWDRPHGTGGAVMSYHHEFLAWLEERLGIDLKLADPVDGGAYRKWTEEEIATWERNQTSVPPADCVRPA